MSEKNEKWPIKTMVCGGVLLCRLAIQKKDLSENLKQVKQNNNPSEIVSIVRKDSGTILVTFLTDGKVHTGLFKAEEFKTLELALKKSSGSEKLGR